ncbi:MAG: winged helix-turn-helix transcriptional regulator [Coriobacteriia bacterium]
MISASGTDTAPIDMQVCDTFHHAIELIGRRWTGAIISVMLKGASRFCELRAAIPGISDRLLTERLRELEDAGIVAREVEATRPPQVTYRLTPKGQALGPVLESITGWSHDWE